MSLPSSLVFDVYAFSVSCEPSGDSLHHWTYWTTRNIHLLNQRNETGRWEFEEVEKEGGAWKREGSTGAT